MDPARVRDEWYRVLERVPVAYCAWQRRHAGRHVVDGHTDLVMEGYPAAANTFARETLQYANPGIRLASHLHSIAHVKRGVRLGVPVLILLRPPADSIVSVVVRFPDRKLAVGTELARYEGFYRGVHDMTGQVALATFGDTTNNLGDVVRVVNRQFGTGFAPPENEDAALRTRVRTTIDRWTEHVFGPDSERHRAYPSDERQSLAVELQSELATPAHCDASARCDELHEELATIARARLDDLRA